MYLKYFTYSTFDFI